MNVRDINVRIVPSSNPIRGWSVEDVDSGTRLDSVIPAHMSEQFRLARPGERIIGFIYSDDPPEIDPTTQDVRTGPVCFHVVSVEIPEVLAATKPTDLPTIRSRAWLSLRWWRHVVNGGRVGMFCSSSACRPCRAWRVANVPPPVPMPWVGR